MNPVEWEAVGALLVVTALYVVARVGRWLYVREITRKERSS